jgi:hypothetical protein
MIILEWLHQHRNWQFSGYKWVLEWMVALTGNRQQAQELFQQLWSTQLTTRDLNQIADALSNNPWQVGIGSAEINEKVVGPYFDASKTTGGFDTPITSVIAQYTRSLTHAGVPQEIIDAALAQLINPKGQLVTSMSVQWSPKGGNGDGFGGGGFGSGGFGGGFGSGGFGGGGFGGGGYGSGFTISS